MYWIITTFTIVGKTGGAEKRCYKFDVTSYIEGDGISICLNASNNYQKGFACIDFREGYWFWAQQDAPQLIWTYKEPLITGFIIVIVILSIIGIIRVGIYKYKLSKKKSKELIPRWTKKIEISIDMKYCSNCGQEIKKEATFCEFCGNKQ